MTPCGLVNCKAFGSQGPSLTNRMSEYSRTGPWGASGASPAPTRQPTPGVRLAVCSDLSVEDFVINTLYKPKGSRIWRWRCRLSPDDVKICDVSLGTSDKQAVGVGERGGAFDLKVVSGCDLP